MASKGQSHLWIFTLTQVTSFGLGVARRNLTSGRGASGLPALGL